MKKYLLLLAFGCTKILSAQITSPAPYCDLNYTFGNSSPTISNVVIGTFSNPTTHCAQPGYIYYNNLGAVPMSAGSSQTITITLANYDLETALKGWIDFNANQIFEPNEEIIYVAQGSVGMNSSITKFATFTVPANAVVGTTRMRIAVGWTFADNNTSTFKLDSCHVAASEYSAGETEDYNVSITSPNGVEEFSSNKISICPNPANDFFKTGINENAEVKIYNCEGEIVFSEIIAGNEGINSSDLRTGIYFVYVKTNENIYCGKLIKE